jgi:hypothetical protein
MRTWWKPVVLAGLLLAVVGAVWRRRRPFDPARPSIGWGLVSLRIDDGPAPATP